MLLRRGLMRLSSKRLKPSVDWPAMRMLNHSGLLAPGEVTQSLSRLRNWVWISSSQLKGWVWHSVCQKPRCWGCMWGIGKWIFGTVVNQPMNQWAPGQGRELVPESNVETDWEIHSTYTCTHMHLYAYEQHTHVHKQKNVGSCCRLWGLR